MNSTQCSMGKSSQQVMQQTRATLRFVKEAKMNHTKTLKANRVKNAYFILKDGRTVEVSYQGNLLDAAKVCKEKHGEVGYLDSVSFA